MDDVAVMSKVTKTAGILGDDLAVNIEKPLDLFLQEFQFCGQLLKAPY
jgi:hypothetical protein